MNAESEDKSDPGAATPEYVVEPAEPVTDIMSLIRELWRRNVFKLGLAYFIAASLFGWVPLLAFAAFDSPDWLGTAIAILLYAGFPVALYFTWVTQPSDRETRQIVLGSFSGLIMSVGLLAVVGGVTAIAAQPSGDVTIYIFGGVVLLAIGVPLTLFGYGGLMKQVKRFKAEHPARADSHHTVRKWVLGTAARLTGIKVALGLFAIAIVGATLFFSTGTPRNTKPTLIAAARIGATGMVKDLIDAGANVNAQRNDGWSALMRAARYGRTETVRLLIEAGADVNANSNDGETALMLASQYDHTGVVDILKQSGAR